MTQTTAVNVYDSNEAQASDEALFMAMELSSREWKLAFAQGLENPRIRTVPAGELGVLDSEVRRTLKLWKMNPSTPVFSCYEAGRDAFWIHRALESRGWKNVVVDPASIEVDRRRRRRKTDRLDAVGLVRRLVRFARGERDVWRVARPPTIEEEDRRRLHREQARLTKERTSHLSRIRGLLVTQGVASKKLDVPALMPKLPPGLRAELQREWERLCLVQQQLKKVVAEMKRQAKEDKSPTLEKVRQLEKLKGVGVITSRVLVTEFFGWRKFKNRRQVGAAAGLCGTPYDSGDSTREQGISKAGNAHVRRLAIELAWMWVRWQPDSQLTRWFESRFAANGKRLRRIGIVALARKLLVALWKYLEHGEVPEGAVFSSP
jgi:transposase